MPHSLVVDDDDNLREILSAIPTQTGQHILLNEA